MLPLEPELKKTICMIGKLKNDDEYPDVISNEQVEAKVYGTGIFLGFEDRSYVVTAKHVVDPLKNPVLISNMKGDKPARLWATNQIYERGDGVWTYHPNPLVDLAAIRYKQEPDEDILAVEESRFLPINQVEGGRQIVMLGYPFGITPFPVIDPMVREGCVGIRLIEEKVVGDIHYLANTILLDAMSTSGNSGGPVFSRPRFVFEKEKLWVQRSLLIGINCGHIEREGVHQGISYCYSMDLVIELLKCCKK